MFCQCVREFARPLVGETRADPQPTGSEIVLKVTAAGLCHSDLHVQSGSYDLGHGQKLYFADRGLKLPRVLGHEVAGRIVALGPQAGDLDTSKTYVIYPWQGCGQCRRCARGDENHCLAPQNLGFHLDGGFATHIKIPHARHLFDIGDLPPEIAAPLACSGLTAYSALQKVRATISESPVVIVGAGGLGLMCVGLVKALGGLPPIVIDIDPIKREAAIAAGALALDGRAEDVVAGVRAAAKGAEIEAIIDFVASERTARIDFDLVTKGGTIVLVGLFGGAAPWSLPMIPLKAVSIIGSVTGSMLEFGELVALARSGRLPRLTTATRPLASANEALMDLQDGRIIGRSVFVPAE